MSALINLTGHRFGRLLVLGLGPSQHKLKSWRCRCDCGSKRIVRGDHLRDGAQVSCGCYRDESIGNRRRTHGQTNTPLYEVWKAMLRRCRNPNSTRYERYGGRGIKVCKTWHKFIPFHNWAFKHGYKVGLSIDRVDNDGDYKPSNCRFITKAENNRAAAKARLKTAFRISYPTKYN